MTHDMDRTGSDSLRSKVAVIVVHGVSDQQPCDSARSIANLLFHQYHDQSRYGPFVEQQIRIPVQALKPAPDESLRSKAPHKPDGPGHLDERGDRIRAALDAAKSHPQNRQRSASARRSKAPVDSRSAAEIDDQIDRYSHAFTCDFLDDYNPQKSLDLSANFYNTIRLETQRNAANPSEQTSSEQAVHLYELYWADLSRLGTGFVQFFSAFYQLLFHLASLGRHTIDLATLEYSSYARGWRAYSELHAWAGRILAIPIPLLSLYLLIAAFLSLPSNIPDRYQPWIAVSVASLFAVTGVSYWLWRSFKQSLLVRIVLPPLVALSIVGLHGLLEQFGYYKLLTIEWLAISAALVGLLLISPYAKRRQGVGLIAVMLGAFLLGVAFYPICRADPQSITEVVNASFMTIEVIYLLLVLVSLLFYLLYVGVVLGGFVLKNQLLDASAEQQAAKKRATRALWTARVSLWMPIVLFTTVTSTLWAGLIFAGTSLLPQGYLYTPTPIFRGLFLSNTGETRFCSEETRFCGSDFFNQLLIDPLAIIILFSLLIALVLVAWSLFPSIWAEVKPPADPTPQAGKIASEIASEKAKRQQEQLTLRFGVWLTQGGGVIYWALNFLTILLAVAILVLLNYYLWGNLFRFFHLNPDFPGWIDQPLRWIDRGIQVMRQISRQNNQILAVLLTASATSIFVLSRRLNQLSLGFHNLLDVMLDVDNYLRLHPKDDNPRARIFARYSSLLRYLYHWSDPQDGQGYDALIIVAHSQGTVITADLLRFLQSEPPQTQEQLFPASKPDARIPITFFSMGSPLNQLYGAGFPHLYNWVLNLNRDSDRAEQTPQDADMLNRLVGNPEPEKLGLDRWVNTFRSGDYVGRDLWRFHTLRSKVPEQQLTELFKLEDSKNSNQGEVNHCRREFCLGAGAHTHYWDATADQVAEEIDRLIAAAEQNRLIP